MAFMYALAFGEAASEFVMSSIFTLLHAEPWSCKRAPQQRHRFVLLFFDIRYDDISSMA